MTDHRSARSILRRCLTLLAAMLTAVGALSATAQASLRVDVFAPRAAGSVQQLWFSPEGTWNGWVDLGGAPAPKSSPAAVAWGPGRVDVFVRGTDNALWHSWFADGVWHPWESLGGKLTGNPAVASWGSGRLDVFVPGVGGRIYQLWFDGTWHPWVDHGGQVAPGSSPTAVSWANGRLDVFVRGSDNALHHKWFSGGTWSAWESLGGQLTGSPGAASWGSGRLDVFAPVAGNRVHQLWFDGGTWHPWVDHGGQVLPGSSVAAVATAWNRIDVFVRGSDGTSLFQKWFDGAVWHDWYHLATGLTGSPAASTWRYPTSERYGGANYAVDTLGETSAALSGMNAAGSDAAAQQMRQGLAPADVTFINNAVAARAVSFEATESAPTLTAAGTPSSGEYGALGLTPAEDSATASASQAKCRYTQSKNIKLAVDDLPDMGWVSQRTRFCYSPLRHTAVWGNQQSMDHHIARGYRLLGWNIERHDFFASIHDWNGYPRGQVNMRRDFDIVFCAPIIGAFCGTEEALKIVTFGRYNGSARARVYNR